MNKPEPKVKAMPRPIRVTYVLEIGDDAHSWLDAIFAECFARDGGRQSLIVPLVHGSISERYRRWMRTIDPDFVVLVTYDNDGLAAELAALLGDTQLLGIERQRDQAELHPRVGIERPQPLTSLSWLPLLKTVSGLRQAPPTQILDRYPSWVDDGLVSDNFGTLYRSVPQFPIHQQIGLSGLMLTPPNPPNDRWHFRDVVGTEVEDAYTLLPDLGGRSDLVTLAQLSNLNSQTAKPQHAWSEGFCLVVGDSVEDRISCWNAGLLFEGAQRQRYSTLRVPRGCIGDGAKAMSIGAFLRNSNWIGGGPGPARVFVRSHSLGEAELDSFIGGLREHARANIAFEPIASIEDCTPPDPATLRRVFHMFDTGPSSVVAAISGKSVAFATPQPPQLAYCRSLHPIFSRGAWLNDLLIDRLKDVGRFSNERQHWVLPCRRQIVRMFSVAEGARLTGDGIPTVPATIDTATLQVTQPDDELVFRALLTDSGNGLFEHQDLRGQLVADPRYKYAEPSDKGSFLQGLVGLFGSLNDVEYILGNHFWRDQFLAMAAPAQSQQEEVIRDMKLRMRARDGVLHLEQPADWENLAQRIIQKANRLRVPRLKTRYSKLLDAWTRELNAAIALDANLQQQQEDLMASREQDLRRSVSFMLERGVLYRGHEWICSECRHRNWRGIDALKEVLPCEVCSSPHLLPASVKLDFQMNEFFATCLREHDTLSVVAALCALRRTSKQSFMYAPQTALYEMYPDGPEVGISRELDVVCISDGKLIIGEAKASSALIARSDIEDLADAAVAVGADKAVLAAMAGEQRVMEAKTQELRDLLPISIHATWILSPWDDQPSFYL
ncbi:hypothetical protein [Cupriavidus alkaliphilus]|uniref:hypothetical protein n=1 Tax=Cupriavidus alkaliphilus TaxID=942866 RepID=UPI001621740E|nr:hypothetical protein [Cupriavidus alkaliphilus]MBB3016208.1 hypothetical protein [Cupriavidus alkaliphilus]